MELLIVISLSNARAHSRFFSGGCTFRPVCVSVGVGIGVGIEIEDPAP